MAYLLGIEGIALLRAFAGDHDRAFVDARVAEVRRLLDRPEFAVDGVVADRVSAADGYRVWSATYDKPGNGIFAYEEPYVHAIVDALPPGDALDAACGTGRHAAYLAGRGHRVIGVDGSPEMLEHARAKVPTAEFRHGDLHDLPVPDDHVDLVVCALALTHVKRLAPVLAEFVRVLRPGGHLVVSDVHFLRVMLGSAPRMRDADGRPGMLPTYRHLASDYLSAALPLGLRPRSCDEPAAGLDERRPARCAGCSWSPGPWDDWPWSLLDNVPAAWAAAQVGVPNTVIWHFQRGRRRGPTAVRIGATLSPMMVLVAVGVALVAGVAAGRARRPWSWLLTCSCPGGAMPMPEHWMSRWAAATRRTSGRRTRRGSRSSSTDRVAALHRVVGGQRRAGRPDRAQRRLPDHRVLGGRPRRARRGRPAGHAAVHRSRRGHRGRTTRPTPCRGSCRGRRCRSARRWWPAAPTRTRRSSSSSSTRPTGARSWSTPATPVTSTRRAGTARGRTANGSWRHGLTLGWRSMKIAVFGAGGTGGYFGGRLAAAGHDVGFVARGEHLDALRREGLAVQSVAGDFTVAPVRATDDPGELGPVDAVLLCVKTWQLTDAVAALAPLLGEDTAVVTMQNGVEAPAQVADAVGRDRVLPGVCQDLRHDRRARPDPPLRRAGVPRVRRMGQPPQRAGGRSARRAAGRRRGGGGAGRHLGRAVGQVPVRRSARRPRRGHRHPGRRAALPARHPVVAGRRHAGG